MTKKPNRNQRAYEMPGLLAPVLVIVVSTLIAFSTAFSGTFILDDQRTIVMNEDIRSLSSIAALLTQSRRPVVDISLAISGAIAGPWTDQSPPDTAPFHAVNILIHALAALALFDLARRLALRVVNPHRARRVTWAAAALAALWAVHPLQTESVTYIIQRAESLAGLFYLLALWSIVRASESTGRARLLFSVGAVAASFLAMGSKATAVTIPITALLMDRAFLAHGFVPALRQRWPIYAGLVASLGVLALTGVAGGVLGTKQTTGPATVGFLYEGVSPTTYFLSQPGVILHYLRMTFIPIGQCLDYAWQPVESFAGSIPAMLPVIALGLVALWGLWKNTWWGFVGAWFFVILGPTSSFIPIKDLAFEHRMYLPLAAPLALAVYLVLVLARRIQPRAPLGFALGALALLGLVFALTTINRNAVYQSERTMWTDITLKAPHNARAWSNLGMIAARSTPPDNDLAERALRNAIQNDPELSAAKINLANVLARTGKPGEAVELYEQFEDAVIADRNQLFGQQALTVATSASARGLLLVQLGRVEEAASAFERAAALTPDRPDNHVYLSRTLAQLGRLDEAEASVRRALTLDPNNAPARRTLQLIQQLRAAG